MKYIMFIAALLFICSIGFAQENQSDKANQLKKKIFDSMVDQGHFRNGMFPAITGSVLKGGKNEGTCVAKMFPINWVNSERKLWVSSDSVPRQIFNLENATIDEPSPVYVVLEAPSVPGKVPTTIDVQLNPAQTKVVSFVLRSERGSFVCILPK